ncbi:phenylalanine-tRNA ligase beta subunit [Ceratobasidium sp. AG-Ba]|nr:phenylalanine-tRNA ligase beta subunit [Ceratobasidium sp. AG-Ba]
MFPTSQPGVPRTRAQMSETEPKTEQVPTGRKMYVEDLEDPPGEEMTKSARVWKTYMREADRWDKEMVDGRNSSLDVLLIFVSNLESQTKLLDGLTSPTFIIESLGDLKPDSAESSARSLIAISRKLDVIVSGQQPEPPPAQDSPFDDYSPAYSAIVVNILWLLSLSLSVAVSLIAMLAKEWCYKFTIGRSGPTYEQARKRQQKWNGIERWKMQEVLSYLPGVMHSALLLFAVGLCIYLRDISMTVAIPVTVITSISGCIYILTTVLPCFDQFCPYSTPLTSLLMFIQRMAYLSVNYEYYRVIHRGWLQSCLRYLVNLLNPNYPSSQSSGKDDIYVPMDDVTSQMLAWMITNCDNSRSVDIALQAVAGARSELPHTHLQRCDTFRLAYSQVISLTHWDAGSKQLYLANEDILGTVLRLCRTCTVLIFGGAYWCDISRQSISSESSERRSRIDGLVAYHIVGIYSRLLDRAARALLDRSALAIATAGCLPYCSLNWEMIPAYRAQNMISFESVIERADSILEDYASLSSPYMSWTILVPLLESYAYYMTAYWPGSKEPRQSPVPATLIRIYLQAHDNAPDICCIIAITLAATTFAIDSYPAATGPTQPGGDRLKRALHVLEHYRTNRPELWDTDRLFVFGLVGLLSCVDLSPLGPYPGLISQLYDQCVSAMFAWLLVPATLPDSYTINSHITASRQRFQPPITETPRVPGVDSNTISLYCLFMQAGLFHQELFIPALVICRFAVTKNLQDTCIRTLASLPISGHPQVDSLLRDRYMLRALFGAPYTTERYVTSATVFYFRVLVSSVMLNNNIELSMRQLALKDLLVYHEQCTGMKPTSRNTVAPSEWSIITHVGEDTSRRSEADCMRQTIQIVADFCWAGSSLRDDTKMGLVSESSPRDPSAMPPWQIKLQALKDSFEPIPTTLESSGLSSAGKATQE